MACALCVSGAPPTIASLHPLIGSCQLDPAPPAMATRGAFTTTAPERLIQSLRRNAAYSFWVDFTRRLRVGPPEALNYYCKDYSSRRSGCPNRHRPAINCLGFDVAAVIFRRQEATRNFKSRVNAHASRRSRILVIGFARNLDNVINQSFALELSCARMLVAKFLRPNNSTFGPSPADGADGGTSARLPIRRSGTR